MMTITKITTYYELLILELIITKITLIMLTEITLKLLKLIVL